MLKRVSIQNFKSLKDVTLDLQKVNLLIGPNNSGKTNFLKALKFIGPSRKEKHDINQICFAKNTQNKFDIKLLWPSDRDDYIYKGIGFYWEAGQIEEQRGYYENKSIEIEPGYIPIHQNFFPDYIKLPVSTSELEKTEIYKPDPNKLDKPSPVGRGDDSVAADASNLIAFFDRIRDEYPASFAQIKVDLAKCIPEFTEINFQNVGSTDELVKQFGNKTFKRIGLTDGRQKTIYWADELSEGTLYFIALLCIINQPNPPKLLLLEEPERGIHPRRIWEVMKLILQLADEKDIQIILTTHNEHVLDAFASMPESVFVFDKDETTGATYVRNLQQDIIEPTNKECERLGLDPIDFTSNLGERWMYGLIGGVPTDEL